MSRHQPITNAVNKLLTTLTLDADDDDNAWEIGYLARWMDSTVHSRKGSVAKLVAKRSRRLSRLMDELMGSSKENAAMELIASIFRRAA